MQRKFTKEEIRKFLVVYYGLNELDAFGCGKEGVVNYFDRVRSIQFDPLNIIGKNTELVLQSRFSNFNPKLLDELLYQDNILIDGFDKEACIYQTKEWKEFSRIRLALSDSHTRVLKYRNNEAALEHLDEVYTHVLNNQHTCSKDIKIDGGVKGKWGSSSLSNCALHHLWCQGRVGISKRKRSVKYYSDIKYIVPEDVRGKEDLGYDSFIKWYTLRRLDSLGVYWLKKGPGWQGLYFYELDTVKKTVQSLVDEGEVIEIEIEEMKGVFYLTNQAYEVLIKNLNTQLKESLRFIAPLDNFIWDRKLIKELFDFEYTWEVYVPEAKRKFGYYVLPILYKDELIGRIEPSRDKEREEKLVINNLWFEDEKYNNKRINDLLQKEIKRFNEMMSE